jgi:hypothetical protein
MRSRPEIDVKLPSSVLPGETLHVDLTVTGRSVTPIDFISIDVHSTNGTRNPLQNTGFEQHELYHSTVNVAEKGELEAAEYHYRASFEIPDSLPPTYLGAAIEHHAWITVRVAIPWWLDVSESFDVTIVPHPVARPLPVAAAGSSLRAGEPFVEVSLGAQRFAPGDSITGAIAFGNLGSARLEYCEAALVGYEKFVGSGMRYGPLKVEVEAHRHTAFLAVTGEGQGRAIPFRVAVPASTQPSLALPRGTLFWIFEVRLVVQGAATVVHRTPVTIEVFEGRARATSAEPPAIGASRWHALWEEAGSKLGLTIDRKKLNLTGELSGCAVSLTVGNDDAMRGSLVARLRFRSWGIGLSLSNNRALGIGTYFPADELGRRFRIKGRDPVQIDATLTPALRAALLGFDEVRLGDDQIEVRSATPGYEKRGIAAFLGRITALAQALDRAADKIPAPTGMAPFLRAWRSFAAVCDAELTVGNMAITGGEFEGAVFEIRTELEARMPVATTLDLVIDPPLDAAVARAVHGVSADPVVVVPAAAREILKSIDALCSRLLETDAAQPFAGRPPLPEVGEALISMRLPLVLEDPASLRDLLSALLSLAAALRGERRAGPYR